MDETIIEVEGYEEVVDSFKNNSFQSDHRIGDAAPFKGPHQTVMIILWLPCCDRPWETPIWA